MNNGINYQMIKIFQIITSIEVGGAENVAFRLVDSIRKKNNDFDFTIIELYKSKSKYSKEKKQELVLNGVRFITLFNGNRLLSLVFAPFVLFYLIIKNKPNVIHSHTDLPDFVLSNTLRLLTLFRISIPKIVRTIHNTELWQTHRKLGKFVEKSFDNDYVVGVSDVALQAYQRLRFESRLSVSNYLSVVFNGCSIPQRKELPFKLNSEKINVAFCGRLEQQKGIDVLIDRIKSLHVLFANHVHFHVIGNGSYERDVELLANEYENVFRYDSISNISEKLANFDFIIMPSRFEGLVLLSIEASYAKVPVIAAVAPGLSETLPSDWPLTFHLDNSNELEDIFNKIIDNEYDLELLKSKAYTFVNNTFSLEKMVESYIEIYLQ